VISDLILEGTKFKHLVLYHLEIDGGALMELADESIDLRPGDVVVFPHGNAHYMSSGKTRPGRSITTGLKKG
jgi:mannose-6-phosphate isomerase-like protein (cupin superfamily)